MLKAALTFGIIAIVAALVGMSGIVTGIVLMLAGVALVAGMLRVETA